MVCKKTESSVATKCTWTQQCKCLYAAGFRLIETENISSNVTSEGCLLVYKPHLIPSFQVEDGVVGDRIETSVVLNFCEDVISSMNHASDGGKQEANQVQVFMQMLKESSNLTSNIVRSSFPWNGLYTCLKCYINSENLCKYLYIHENILLNTSPHEAFHWACIR